MAKEIRKATVFPRHLESLSILGENINLAMLRRKISKSMMHERTGLSRVTIRKITKGDPGVSMGHYVIVLGHLGLVEGLEQVAANDPLGRKIQDIEMKREQ